MTKISFQAKASLLHCVVILFSECERYTNCGLFSFFFLDGAKRGMSMTVRGFSMVVMESPLTSILGGVFTDLEMGVVVGFY